MVSINYSFLIAIGGFITFSLLVFEVLIGLRVIKLSIKFHKTLGFVVLGMALFHGTFAFLNFMGLLPY
ncbi:MAG: hypothetical protein A2086_01145 [Spirochaetes bacterium GWD1_27_9]|nr:MAG: hypothetical protein A2Z98_16075 [Spirochaetes bacterium GWB1_27_13]OHD27976.1 MAG: hypothetical protein A2Y34_11455 [Spirochaetes bacterium GWC1_27_15]OHD33658.1 MAG: hypothetical protein A2086_01145 [Spirochaetes bacterium GWD1_27_9]